MESDRFWRSLWLVSCRLELGTLFPVESFSDPLFGRELIVYRGEGVGADSVKGVISIGADASDRLYSFWKKGLVWIGVQCGLRLLR